MNTLGSVCLFNLCRSFVIILICLASACGSSSTAVISTVNPDSSTLQEQSTDSTASIVFVEPLSKTSLIVTESGEVVSFTLIDADTDQPIPLYDPIPEGAILDLANLAPRLAIRANTNPSPVGSVVLELQGPTSRIQTENVPPYSLFSDTFGDLQPWSPSPPLPGSYALSATPYSGINGSGAGGSRVNIRFQVAIQAPSNFSLTLDFIDNSLTPTQQAIVRAAATRWSEVIRGDLPDVSLPGPLPAGFCGPNFPEIPQGTLIDDIRVQVTAATLFTEPSQPGGTLAQAGPCGFLREGSGIASSARLAIDPFDIDPLEAEGSLFAVVLHELGHTLGIGINFPGFTWAQFVSGNPPAFTGLRAIEQFNTLGGVGSVPLQANPPGFHWDEAALGNELMTPFVNRGGDANPLSRITAGALIDLLFPEVDLNATDPFSPPAASSRQRRGRRIEQLLNLPDDVVPNPF